MADSFEQLRSEFLAETEDTLQKLQQDLNELAQAARSARVPDQLLDRVFRTTHSLKGVAGLFGLTRMSAVSHSMESLLESIRRGDVPVDDDLADLLHRGNEVLHALLAAGTAGDEATEDGAATSVIADLEAALAARAPAPSGESCPLCASVLALDPGEREDVEKAFRSGRTVVAVGADLPSGGFEQPFRQLLDAIRAWGTVHGTVSTDPGGAETFHVRIVTSGSDELFPLMKGVGGLGGNVLIGDLSRLFAPEHTESAPGREALPAEAVPARIARAGGSLRVPVERADRLLTQLGDLIHAKMGLDDTASAFLAQGGRASPTTLRQSLRGLDRHIRSLQDGILGVRLVSLAPLFQKLERAFREACRSTGKVARLETEGERLELDKGVVEAIADAMVHLVRNAVDHGLEHADARTAHGKPREGTVWIRARAEGSHTVVEVGDDGRGVDFDRVRERARERGMLQGPNEPSRAELLHCLLQPGFTMKDKVSQISGRGVGLDVVRHAVVRIGGTIEIVERPVGSTFRLRVPVSLAVTRALEVVAGGWSYFLPMSHVRRALRLDPDETVATGDERMVLVDGDAVPLRSLAGLLGSERGAPPEEPRAAVLLGVGERRLVVGVDRVGRRHEIVTQSLGPLLTGARYVSGCTELGDGRTVLILDPMALLETAGRSPARTGA